VQDVAPGGLVCPSGHAVHVTALVVALYVFASHGVQPRSFVAVAGVVTCSPAAQIVHAVQVGWLDAEVYVSGPQAAHVRFSVADASLLMCSPAGQVAHAVQPDCPLVE
jgi:hypothetical protein